MFRLRLATLDDVPLLRHWDAQPHVRAAVGNDVWRWESELAESAHWCQSFIAELDGRPIGFLQIMDPADDPDRYWGEVNGNPRAVDIWIGEAADLGKGYGTRIMQQTIDEVRSTKRN